jgi:hypothetical protein
MSGAARGWALVIAMVGWLGLAFQALDVWATEAGVTTASGLVWYMARYFTNLTNLLAAVTLTMVAVAARAAPRGWLGGVAFWLLVTAIVYHLLLAATSDPVGWGVWADLLLHTVVPALVFGWWLAFADKRGLGLGHALAWLLWPLIYCGYALVRGQVTGVYPYFFVNVETQGWLGVGQWVAILCAAFFIGGALLVGLARAMSR